MLNIQPLYYLPKWVTGKAVVAFFIAFALCTVVFGYPMELRYATISILSVLLFFFASQELTRKYAWKSEKFFLKNVFWIGLVVHLLWVAYCYFYFNMDYYKNPYGDGADVEGYIPQGLDCANALREGNINIFSILRSSKWMAAVDDTGYPMWLGIIYFFTSAWGDFGETLVPMIIKCIISTYSAILIYHVAQRHFSDVVARITCVFITFNPNMIYWCGTMFKEPELVFLCCLFVNEMDKALGRNAKMTFKTLLPATLVGMTLFLYRSALGLVAFAAVFAQVVMASQRIMSVGKKIIAGILVAIVLAIGLGESLQESVRRTIDTVQSNEQRANMEWRSKRKDEQGRTNNLITKYATATIFAPLIFTIPFPTFNVSQASQIRQQMLSGGSYIKNILSFFVIWTMFMMLFSREWRRHVFIIAYTCGYLACLVLSNFAHSGRFHMPIMPMLMLFAAYGISLVHQRPKWKSFYTIVLAIEIIACLGWNWFKLKGRGMI